MSDGILLGIGNPLLDISANTGMDLMNKYGLKPASACLAEEKHLPIYQEMVDNFDVDYIAGGATQNAIRVAQWHLNFPGTSFLGCVGKDKFGAQLKEAASKDGVNVQYMEVDSNPTGTCAVLIADKERSLCANIGACNDYDPAHLDKPEIKALVDKAQFFYIASFFVTASQESVAKLAKHAAENNKVFSMNLSAPFLMEVPPFLASINANIPYCDIVFANETEAEAFGKSQGWETTDIAEIASKLQALPKINDKRERLVIFTQGKDPTIVASGGGKVTKFDVPPVPEAEILDTNGAGDSFVGGFLSQYVQGRSLEEAVRCGHYSAGEIIRRSGCELPAENKFKPAE
eukprot:TRINITY_DN1890_c0_g1_i3.p2 TRINITY_DN1890_c0_g1~~TRINITY_DN1890_c0_g1_i3.p2  ORF type:complete len:346 (+),score=139.96 TRINITY_DN1890_c0_g1_i3:79-1116(+)